MTGEIANIPGIPSGQLLARGSDMLLSEPTKPKRLVDASWSESRALE